MGDAGTPSIVVAGPDNHWPIQTCCVAGGRDVGRSEDEGLLGAAAPISLSATECKTSWGESLMRMVPGEGESLISMTSVGLNTMLIDLPTY